MDGKALMMIDERMSEGIDAPHTCHDSCMESIAHFSVPITTALSCER